LAELVNLSRVRKNRHKEQEAAAAQRNRVKFGRTRSERLGDEAEERRSKHIFDQKKLETSNI